MADFRSTADKAYGQVDVSESVIDLLTGVRNYLQVRAARGRALGALPCAAERRGAEGAQHLGGALAGGRALGGQLFTRAHSHTCTSSPCTTPPRLPPPGQVRAAGIRVGPPLHEGGQDAAGARSPGSSGRRGRAKRAQRAAGLAGRCSPPHQPWPLSPGWSPLRLPSLSPPTLAGGRLRRRPLRGQRVRLPAAGVCAGPAPRRRAREPPPPPPCLPAAARCGCRLVASRRCDAAALQARAPA